MQAHGRSLKCSPLGWSDQTEVPSIAYNPLVSNSEERITREQEGVGFHRGLRSPLNRRASSTEGTNVT